MNTVIHFNDFELILPPPNRRSVRAVNVNQSGKLTVNLCLYESLSCKEVQFYISKDKRTLLLCEQGTPNSREASASYRLPKNGTIHNCEFTRDYIRKGLTLPVRYEMYWNEQEQLWMGICTGFPPLPSVKELAQKLPPKLGKARAVI